jgi:hypothetical protein
MSPEIVSFTKSGGPLTKKISLDGNGRLISDGTRRGIEVRLVSAAMVRRPAA